MGDEGLADAPRQDEGQRAPRNLLVLRDEIEELFGPWQFARHVRELRRQSYLAKMRFHPGRIVGARKVHARGEPVRKRHANGNPLAMDQTAAIVAGRSLQRVAERMPEIEQGAIPTFALIACNNLGLRLASFRNRMLARFTAGKNIAPIR